MTNVVKVRPPENDFGVFYEDKWRRHPSRELVEARDQLLQELADTDANIIVAMGAEALKALTPHRKISDQRGSI